MNESVEGAHDDRQCDAPLVEDLLGGERSMRARIPRNQVAEWISGRLQMCLRNARGQHHTECGTKSPCILDRSSRRSSGDLNRHGASCVDESVEPLRVDAALLRRIVIQGTQESQQVGRILHVSGASALAAMTDLLFDRLDCLKVQQCAKFRRPEQVGEERDVDAQCARPAFRQRGVAFVQVSGDVPEEQ